MGTHRERSRCPIAYALDVFGDHWTFLILRDLVFKDRRYFQDFLSAPEGISSNLLTSRLRRLREWGLVVKVPDASDRRRARYFLTDEGLDLLPVLYEMAVWGSHRYPDPDPDAVRLIRSSTEPGGLLPRLREGHAAERKAAIPEEG